MFPSATFNRKVIDHLLKLLNMKHADINQQFHYDDTNI